MERWEWLIEPKTGIYQDPDLGCFTEDSIKLVHFAGIRETDAVLDVGTGNGVLSGAAAAATTGISLYVSTAAISRKPPGCSAVIR